MRAGCEQTQQLLSSECHDLLQGTQNGHHLSVYVGWLARVCVCACAHVCVCVCVRKKCHWKPGIHVGRVTQESSLAQATEGQLPLIARWLAVPASPSPEP